MIRINPDGTPKPATEQEDRTQFPEESPEELEERAWRKLKADAARMGKPWWKLWLEREQLIWFRLAAASEGIAAMRQASFRTHGKRTGRPDVDSNQERRDFIAHRLKQFPGDFEKHWPEIEHLLFLELREGDNNFSRRIAAVMKSANATVKKLRGAIREAAAAKDDPNAFQAAKEAYNRAWDEAAHENPGREGYANNIDRFLVKHWIRPPHPDCPPFCAWTNEAILEVIRSLKPADAFTKKCLEKRLKALGLFKIPARLVVMDIAPGTTAEAKPSKPIILRPPHPFPTRDRIKAACSSLSVELCKAAFPRGEAAITAAAVLLYLDRTTGGLSPAVKKHLFDSAGRDS
jgi:hypothetical protein